MNKTGLIVTLGVLYVFALLLSFQGWGYSGYHRNHHRSSFFYFGGPRTYYGNSYGGYSSGSRSVRGGSTGGSRSLGGGRRGGK